jgi:hypothetical protein
VKKDIESIDKSRSGSAPPETAGSSTTDESVSKAVVQEVSSPTKPEARREFSQEAELFPLQAKPLRSTLMMITLGAVLVLVGLYLLFAHIWLGTVITQATRRAEVWFNVEYPAENSLPE